MKDRTTKWLVLLGSVLFLTLTLAPGTRLMAQQYFGSIVGNVTDPSGAAVPDSTVTATNINTKIERSVKTDSVGSYRIVDLIPGTYSVKVEKTGFETSVVPSLELTVSSTLNINVTLKLGEVTQTVEVQAVAPLLDTTSATVGTTVSNADVLEIPLNGRAYTDLLALIPGSVGNGNIYQAAGGQNYSISGNRSEQNDFTLDGVSNNEGFFKAYAIQPSIDSIQEFKVQTNITSSEFGEAAGANVAVATKSGTNNLHGSAYEFVRNEVLDATEFFNNKTNTPKTPLRRNQYGFTLGGPIYFPHIFNGRDKAFWFFDYEGLKLRQASTALGTIPTTAELQGNLNDPTIGPVYDPLTTTQTGTDKAGNPIYGRQQLNCNGALNVICPGRLDAFDTAYAALWYPGTTSLPSKANGGYNSVIASPYKDNQYLINSRVDYKIKDNIQFFARYTDQDSSSISPYALANNFNNLINHFQNAEGSVTWLASPTTVVDFKSAFNRTLIFTADNNRGWDSFLSSHPINGTPIQNANYPLFPQMYIAGYTAPSQTGNPFLTTSLQELASVSMIRGKHSMKAGFELNHMHGYTDGLFTSIFDYSNLQTADPNPADTAATGSSLASFLLGIPSGGTRNVGITAAYVANTIEAVYFQDDIKLKPNLTVNLGLRYEYDQWPQEVHGHLSEFDFASGKFVWAGKNPLLGVGPNISDPSLMAPDYKDFAPRVGLSYGWGDKTTIRAGYGIFYSSNYYWEGQGARGTWPYAIADTLGGLNGPSVPQTITNTETMYPTYNFPTLGTPADAQHTMGRYNRTPYSEQWNIGVQRQLAHNLMLEVEYVGDGGRHMSLFTNVNDPLPGPGTVGQPGHFRPYQYADALMGTYPTSGGFGADSQMANEVSSSYNALQVKLDKKFSNGLQFLLSYAYGHYIDIGGSGFSQSSAPQNDQNFGADRGNGTFDERHIFTGSWVYDLPAGKGRQFLNSAPPAVNAVLGGWELTGIFKANTGQPLGIGLSEDIANVGQRSLSERPNYLGGPQRITPASGTDQTVGYLNKSAFVKPAPYNYGNLGRNTARNLGFQQFDLGLYKNFPIRENKESFQIRAEFFNAFNHVNLGGIDGTVEDSTFGAIGGTNNNSREIQFALKLYF
ncbi:MAG TPA: TonB-dependent receptor [Terriglobia bacterium]|nr:TonB-dependent receptor [Terriglobia bacterium]